MSPDTFILFVGQYGYVVMASSVLILGPYVILGAGFLIRLGYIALLPTIIAFTTVELASDIVWYALGRAYGEHFVQKFGPFFGIDPHDVQRAKHLFQKHTNLIIFFSKLTAGFGLAAAIFFTAGLSRVSFVRYMLLNIVGEIIWLGALLSAGYFAGNLYVEIGTIINGTLTIGSIALAIIIVFFILARVRRKMLNRLEQ